MDSSNAYIDLEANITVGQANPVVEVSVQISEVSAHDSNNAIMFSITTQLMGCRGEYLDLRGTR